MTTENLIEVLNEMAIDAARVEVPCLNSLSAADFAAIATRVGHIQAALGNLVVNAAGAVEADPWAAALEP